MIAVAFITVSIIVIFNLNSLVNSFLGLSEERSTEVASDMKKWSESTKVKIGNIYEESLKTKGSTLLIQDSLVMRPAFLDNAITDVKKFLTKKFSLDDEIVHASFFTVESDTIKAWHYVNTHYPEGVGFIASYDKNSESWVSEKDKTEIRILDKRIPFLTKINQKNLETIDYEIKTTNGSSKKIKAYEAIIPVVEGHISEVEQLRNEGEPIGYLRYILSLEKMQDAITNEEQAVSEALFVQQEKGLAADLKTRDIGRSVLSKSIAIVGISALCILLFSLVVSAKIAAHIARPIVELTESAAVIASGDYNKEVQVKSTDEVGVLGNTFNDMRLKVKRFTENLQELIDEKTEDILSMLANIEQGIFTITKDHTIHPEYSTYLEKIFATSNIANQPFEKLIFKDASLSNEQISCAKSAVLASLENDKFVFKVNFNHFPREFSIKRNGDSKHLEFDWCPILKNNKIEKIMVTVRDVTELKKLQEVSKQKALELAIIEQLMQIETVKFNEIYQQTTKLLSESFDLCSKEDLAKNDIAIIFRNLHTVKGVLRTYGLKITSSLIHDIEEVFIGIKNSGSTPIDGNQQSNLQTQIQESIVSLGVYKKVNDEILGRSIDKSQIDQKSLAEVKRVIRLFLSDALVAEKLFGKVESILNNTYRNSIKEHIGELVGRVSQAAKTLGKEPLRFHYDGEDIILKTEAWNILDGIFTHMIRNSLDHGIESDEERKRRHKPSSGLISLQTRTDDTWLYFTFFDDGRGLNIKKIREKAQVHQETSDQEVAHLIFSPSMSTADKVTDISGRGVGMDAVKASIEAFGGKVALELSERIGDFTPIKIHISLPLVKLGLDKANKIAV